MTLARWASTPAVVAFLTVVGGLYLTFEAGIFHDSILVGWGIVIMAGGLLGFASLPLLFLKRAKRANGSVIAHKKYSYDGYYPIVRYILPNGQEATFRSSVVRRRQSLPASTKVAVLYDPSDPESAIINRFKEKCMLFLTVCLILFLFVLPLLFTGISFIVGLMHVPSTTSIGVDGGPISFNVDPLSPIGIGIAILATISTIVLIFRVLRGYHQIKKQIGKHSPH